MEQPYEKCLENGPESLSDAELLAVILRCGARGKTSLELAREILSLPGKEEGLLGLYHCTRQELLQIRGVGERFSSSASVSFPNEWPRPEQEKVSAFMIRLPLRIITWNVSATRIRRFFSA
jgi:hypothetical protein